jgi:type IV pilus assembly protein PilO
MEKLPVFAQALVFAALSAGLVVVFYIFYLRGPLEERENLLTELARLEAAILQAKTIESKLSRLKSDLGLFEERLEILRHSLMSSKEISVVLRSVQQMAAASNLRIIRFAPQPVVPRAFYSAWPIVMEVEGNYDALGLFFEKISRLARIVNVDNMSVKGIDGSSASVRTLSAVCTVTTFILKEASPSTRPDLP